MAAPVSFINAINNILGTQPDDKIEALWASIVSSGYNRYSGGASSDAITQTRYLKEETEKIERNVFHTRDILDRIAESQKEVNRLQKELNDLESKGEDTTQKKLELARATLRLREEEQQKQIDGYNKIDKFNDDWDNRTKQFKKGVNEIRDGIRKIGDSVNKALGPWTKMSQSAADYAKNIGLSGRGMDKLRKSTIDAVANRALGIKYNTSVEELIGLQKGYTNETGRQIQFSNSNYENIAATSRIFGADATNELFAKFENFGLSLNDASERAGKMFATASKYGLSLDKYSKNVRENINLAQKYTFRNGLRGLDSMAKKATEIGLNMSQAASFAEQVNTVEGAIRTGAKLQVLGGPFAQMADPIGMLYEGLNDLEGLQDRMTQMFGNLGTFNKQTGEVELSAFNKVRVREAAKSMGVDENNLFESINAQARRNEIANQIRDNININEDTAELLKNVGILQNGVAGVNINGEFVEASKITNGHIKYLQEIARSESDDVKDIAVRLRGWDDAVQGFKKQQDAVHGQAVERMGIGRGIQNIIENVGEMKTLLKMLAYGTMAAGAVGMIGGAFGMVKGGSHVIGGTRNILSKRLSTDIHYMSNTGKGYTWSGGLKNGKLVNSNGRTVPSNAYGYNKLARGAKLGKISAGVSKVTSVAGIAGVLGDIATSGYIERNPNKRGGFIDYAGHTASRAASMAMTGAQLGSLVGPLGTIIGAGIGAIGGGIWGGIDARKNQLRRHINEATGLELNGSYGTRELKQIRDAARGEGTLSAKLIEKIQENGDSLVLEEIKRITNSTVLPDGSIKVTVLNSQKKATGGIVEGKYTSGDRNVVMSDAGEMVLNHSQQSTLWNAIKSGDFSDITPKNEGVVTENVSEIIYNGKPDVKENVQASIPNIGDLILTRQQLKELLTTINVNNHNDVEDRQITVTVPNVTDLTLNRQQEQDLLNAIKSNNQGIIEENTVTVTAPNVSDLTLNKQQEQDLLDAIKTNNQSDVNVNVEAQTVDNNGGSVVSNANNMVQNEQQKETLLNVVVPNERPTVNENTGEVNRNVVISNATELLLNKKQESELLNAVNRGTNVEIVETQTGNLTNQNVSEQPIRQRENNQDVQRVENQVVLRDGNAVASNAGMLAVSKQQEANLIDAINSNNTQGVTVEVNTGDSGQTTPDRNIIQKNQGEPSLNNLQDRDLLKAINANEFSGITVEAKIGNVIAPSTAGDSNVVASNAGGMTINSQQKDSLFNAIKTNDNSKIKVEPKRVEATVTQPVPTLERPITHELTGTWNINIGGTINAVLPDGSNKKIDIDVDAIKRQIEQGLIAKISEELSRMERGGKLVPEKGFLYQRG